MISSKNIYTKVVELTKRYPERVYIQPVASKVCSYIDSSDMPGFGCIFGMALSELGIDSQILQWASGTQENEYGQNIEQILEKLEISHPLYFFRNVQAQQDAGTGWGRLLEVVGIPVEFNSDTNSSGSDE